jgi:Tfp pilus assembly protein PilZ
MNHPYILIASKGQGGFSRLERVLQRWGCRTLIAAGEVLKRLLLEDKPDLLLIATDIRKGERLQLSTIAAQRDCPLFEIEDHFRVHPDGLPKDILAFLEALQNRLVHFVRRELRIRMSLPVLIEKGGSDHIGQILSLGAGGIFLKNGCSQAKVDDRVQVTIPLLGMKKELELTGRVLYVIEATQENGFRQGLGIAFQDCDAISRHMLRDYIRMVLELDTPDPLEVSSPEEEDEECTGDAAQLRRIRGPSLALFDRRIGPSC